MSFELWVSFEVWVSVELLVPCELWVRGTYRHTQTDKPMHQYHDLAGLSEKWFVFPKDSVPIAGARRRPG